MPLERLVELKDYRERLTYPSQRRPGFPDARIQAGTYKSQKRIAMGVIEEIRFDCPLLAATENVERKKRCSPQYPWEKSTFRWSHQGSPVAPISSAIFSSGISRDFRTKSTRSASMAFVSWPVSRWRSRLLAGTGSDRFSVDLAAKGAQIPHRALSLPAGLHLPGHNY